MPTHRYGLSGDVRRSHGMRGDGHTDDHTNKYAHRLTNHHTDANAHKFANTDADRHSDRDDYTRLCHSQ
jgi:hypothetical protein